MTTSKENRIEIEKILESATLFGSRRWGGYTAKSDWDYLVSEEDYEKIYNLLEHSDWWNFTTSSGSPKNGVHMLSNITSMKFQKGSEVINIIGYTSKNLPKAILCTNMLDLMPPLLKEEMAEDKRVRYRIVEAIFDVYLYDEAAGKR